MIRKRHLFVFRRIKIRTNVFILVLISNCNTARIGSYPENLNSDLYKNTNSCERMMLVRTEYMTQSLDHTLSGILRQLDYALPYGKQRAMHAADLLNHNHVLEVIDQRHGRIREQLERMADYMLFAKYNDEEDEQLQHNRKKDMLTQYSRRKASQRELGNPNEVSRNETNIKYRVPTKPTVTAEDKQQFVYLKEMDHTLLALEAKLGYGTGFTPGARAQAQRNIAETVGRMKLYQMKRMYAEVKSESLAMKELLRGTFRFANVSRGSTKISLSEDTGYFQEDDYVHISENKIDLKDERHVYHLIDLYPLLKESCRNRPHSELYAIIFCLEETIADAELNDVERSALNLRMQGSTGKEICEQLKDICGVVLSQSRISQLTKSIARKVVAAYLDRYEEWLYTFKVKGKYKTCSRCNKPKLATDKYFGKDKHKPDGFKYHCKACDKKS